MAEPTRILIYEDNDELASWLMQILAAVSTFKVVGHRENCDSIKTDLSGLNPDVILMDIEMPGVGGLEGLKIARTLMGDKIKILMLTVFEDNDKIFESLKQGADGYILKKTPPVKIIEFIRDAMEGGAPMTPVIARKVLESFSAKPLMDNEVFRLLSAREKQVLAAIVEGNSYRMIGKNLSISVDTVRSHIRSIYEKLHVNSNAQAVAKALGKKLE